MKFPSSWMVLPLVIFMASVWGGYLLHQNAIYKAQVKSYKAFLVSDYFDPEAAKFRNVVLLGGPIPIFNLSWFERENPQSESLKHLLVMYEANGYSIFDLLFRTANNLVLCGQVNGKNMFGVSTGYKSFEVRPERVGIEGMSLQYRAFEGLKYEAALKHNDLICQGDRPKDVIVVYTPDDLVSTK
jgi:hypothetical protein